MDSEFDQSFGALVRDKGVLKNVVLSQREIMVFLNRYPMGKREEILGLINGTIDCGYFEKSTRVDGLALTEEGESHYWAGHDHSERILRAWLKTNQSGYADFRFLPNLSLHLNAFEEKYGVARWEKEWLEKGFLVKFPAAQQPRYYKITDEGKREFGIILHR